MKEILTKNDLVFLINQVADDVLAAKDELTDLDAAIGDGDLGVTMTLGFNAVKEVIVDTDEMDMQAFLMACAMAFAENAASTFGTLMVTMFSKSGRVLEGLNKVSATEIGLMLRASTEGVQKRGKATLGDKTVLDAMFPAVEAYELAFKQNNSLTECLHKAHEAAQDGAERTIMMRSSAGRSSWLGERTVGQKDPGAAVFVLMLESVCRFVSKG